MGNLRRQSSGHRKSECREMQLSDEVQLDAELGQFTPRVRHDAFATGFVDWRLKSIDEENTSSALPKRDGGGEASGATAHDQYIGCECHKSPTLLM